MPALPFSITLGRPSRGELLSLVGAVLLALEGLHRRNTDMRRRVALLTLGALLTLATAVPVLAEDAPPAAPPGCVRALAETTVHGAPGATAVAAHCPGA